METTIMATSTVSLPFDLQYLYFLQEWRNSIGGSLDGFMQFVSDFAISVWLPLFVAIFYWCFNKKLGTFILMNVGFADLINQVAKMSCCIYRPWIRSSMIKPAGDAIRTAGGYSFPSGHTQCITSYFASFAALTWLKKRWVAIVCFLPILIVGFSRNYLGVHTPEDVVVSFLLCCVVIAFNFWMFEKLGKDKTTDTKYFIGALSFSVVMLMYFVFKNYPMDYTPDGKLIVDPNRMMNDAFAGTGRFLGWLVGWYLETRFINFTVPENKNEKIRNAITGAILLFLVCKYQYMIYRPLGLGMHALCFINGFVPYFFVMAVFPLFIKLSESKTENFAASDKETALKEAEKEDN